jgi:hypothetical protein
MNNSPMNQQEEGPEIIIEDGPSSQPLDSDIIITDNHGNPEPMREREDEADPDSPPLKAHKNRRSAPAQINRQTKIIKEQENYINAMAAEMERLRAEAESYRMAGQQQAALANIHAESVLKSEKEKVKQKLTQAIDEGDSDKIADLTDELAEAHSRMQAIKDREMAPVYQPEPIYQQPQQYQPPVQQAPVQQVQEELDEETTEDLQDWLMENPWCDPESPQYDKRLGQKAAEIGQEISAQLKEKGQEMEPRQFLDTVAEVLERKYPQRVNRAWSSQNTQDPAYNERFYEMPRRHTSPVAPVSRGSTSGYNNTSRRSNQITLTRDQYETAMRIPPMMSGKQLSEREKVELYWKNLQADPLQNSPYNHNNRRY